MASVTLLVFSSATANAKHPLRDAPAPPSTEANRAARSEPRARAPWPQAAAVVPGALVHGAGPWLQGRSQTATRLLWWELASVGLTVGAGAGLALTGAARDVVGPLALTGAAGVTLFGASFLAGLYAVSAPEQGLGSPSATPLLVSAIGYRYLNDPQFAATHYAESRVDAQLGALRLALSTTLAPATGENTVGVGQYRVLGGLRLLGENAIWSPSAATKAKNSGTDDTHLELQTAWNQERFVADGFTSQSVELALSSRLNLQHYLPDVRGAFLQTLAGYARQRTVFDLPDTSEEDTRSLLLARVGFGVYLGRRSVPRSRTDSAVHGEAELYYDHRHDGLVAGLKVPGLGSGVAGHLGVRNRLFLQSGVGLEVTGEVGSTLSVGVSVLYRADPMKAPHEQH